VNKGSFAAATLSLLMPVLLRRQATTSLSGTVTDPTGAVVPNATLILTNVDTSSQREMKSDSEGRYSLAQVQPGSYTR
jgi:hypothetical protein